MNWLTQCLYACLVLLVIMGFKFQNTKIKKLESKLEKKIYSTVNQPNQANVSRSINNVVEKETKPLKEFAEFDSIWISGKADDFVKIDGVIYQVGDYTEYGKVMRVSQKMVMFKRDDNTPFFLINHRKRVEEDEESKNVALSTVKIFDGI